MDVDIPLQQRRGHYPAPGSSVLIKAITDSGGNFKVPGLATLRLL